MELYEKIMYVCKHMYKSNCSLHKDSNDCPFKMQIAGYNQCYFTYFAPKSWSTHWDESSIEQRCDKFIKEHPIRTRQSEMLKIIPDTELEGGIIALCPSDVLDVKDCNNDYDSCYECRKAFWLKEI